MPTDERSKRGCLYWCLVLLILVVIFSIIAVLAFPLLGAWLISYVL